MHYVHEAVDAPIGTTRFNQHLQVIMFSLFRRRGKRVPKYSWMPAVDVTNPRVTAMLLGLRAF